MKAEDIKRCFKRLASSPEIKKSEAELFFSYLRQFIEARSYSARFPTLWTYCHLNLHPALDRQAHHHLLVSLASGIWPIPPDHETRVGSGFGERLAMEILKLGLLKDEISTILIELGAMNDASQLEKIFKKLMASLIYSFDGKTIHVDKSRCKDAAGNDDIQKLKSKLCKIFGPGDEFPVSLRFYIAETTFEERTMQRMLKVELQVINFPRQALYVTDFNFWDLLSDPILD